MDDSMILVSLLYSVSVMSWNGACTYVPPSYGRTDIPEYDSRFSHIQFPTVSHSSSLIDTVTETLFLFSPERCPGTIQLSLIVLTLCNKDKALSVRKDAPSGAFTGIANIAVVDGLNLQSSYKSVPPITLSK